MLNNCTAIGNTEVGFDARWQAGSVTMKGCIGQYNDQGNFKCDYNDILNNCTSLDGGENSVSEDTLTECTGF